MPTNPYSSTPYYNSDTFSGVNDRGDSGNGFAGSLAPGAINNQTDSSKPSPSSDNPYGEILNYMQPQRAGSLAAPPSMSSRTSTYDPYQQWLDSYNQQFTSAPQAAPETPDNPNEPPTGPAPPPSPPPPAPPPNEPPGPGSTQGQVPPPAGSTQGQTPPRPPNPHPEWWSDSAWQLGQQYGANPGYEYLAQNPAYIDEYQSWVAQGAAAGQDRSQVDIVDWLAHRGQNSPQAGRRGYDTFAANADHTPTAWIDQGTMPNDVGTPPAPPPGGFRPPIHPDPYTPPPATTPGGTPPPGTTPGTTPPAGSPGTPPPGTPPPNTPPSTPPDAPPPGTPPTTPPAAPPTTTPPAQSPSDLYALLQQLLAPESGIESNQLNRALNANAALTGDINSGGFGETVGRAQAQLAANQGQRMSDYLHTDYQNGLNRALQYYGINTQANTAAMQTQMQGFIARMQDDTARLGISTNADLQRYLDSEDNAVRRYGIDKNDLLQRYQAELQLQGIRYSADAQVNAAAMNRAASSAMAHAQQAEELARIQSQQAIQHEQLQNQYTEHQGDLAWQQYMFTHPSFNDILSAYLGFTPEQIAHLGLPPLSFTYGP